MLFKKNYAVLINNHKVAIILSFADIIDTFPVPQKIDKVIFDGLNVIVSDGKNTLSVPIANEEDRLLLNNNQKIFSVIDNNGELINILNID